ncbi:ferritin-like domain-containing protein [Thioalbus denitrificans]|uniref:Rubrerythrin n=1 Tax=Thioalbus denitrificans TaxID=547122 RepID=A0A369CES7_9GAMM|nr:ferritin family protein [Thioalbus denitrificans]RCX31186.1 rubrerythrin [Thioalbus denitrificans]
MNAETDQTIATVGELLAHALELELESAERYRELADTMQVHNNPDVASLFHRLASYGDAHAREVKQRAAGLELPTIAPWDFKWTCPDAPESACAEDTHYLMNRCQALQLALHNETRGQLFYAGVAESAPDPDVRFIAAEMAAEEEQHVAMLQEWLAREQCRAEEPPEDLDPPNVSE